MNRYLIIIILSGFLFPINLSAQKKLTATVFAPGVQIESTTPRKLVQIATVPKDFKPIITKQKLVGRSEPVKVNIEKKD